MARAVALLAIGLSVVVAGSVAALPREDVSAGLDRAREFDRFRVFYDGRRHDGLSLTHVDALKDFGRRWWSLIYGDCDPAPCGYPLEIQNWSICVRYPAVYPGDVETKPYRGARAAWVPTAGSYEIYTGRTAVVIFANRHRDFRQAAAKLQDVRFGDRVERFRAPVPGSLRGELDCQR